MSDLQLPLDSGAESPDGAPVPAAAPPASAAAPPASAAAPPASSHFGRRLCGIVALGLLGRVLYVVLVQGTFVGGDGYHYHNAALQLVDGMGFINPLALDTQKRIVPDAVHPPGWTLVLAGVSALGMRSYLAHQITGALVGGLVVLMTGLAGRAMLGARVGLVAAALAAVYPNVWLYERDVAVEPLAMLGGATMLWLVYRYRAHAGAGLAAALGASIAFQALARAELLTLSVLVVAPLILWAPGIAVGDRVARLALAGVVCVLCIAPWSIYNTTRFQRFVPLSNGLGAAMLCGNCPLVYGGERFGFSDLSCVMFVPHRSDDPSIVDGQFRAAAVGFMQQNPHLPALIAARLGRTFGFYRPAQQVQFEAARGTSQTIIWVAFVSYWLLLPFAVAGGVLARRRRIPIYPLLALPLIALLSTAITVGAVRYRAPSEISLVLLAAVALDALYRGAPRRAAPAGGS